MTQKLEECDHARRSNYESRSLHSTTESHCDYVEAVVDSACARGVIDEAGRAYLRELLLEAPEARGSGLSVEEREQFVASTTQAIEVCLLDREVRRSGFVNGLLQVALDARGDEPAWHLVEVNDAGRRGTDRRTTFGQVKERPRDPDYPSFFGGSWVVRRGAELRKVVFAIHALGVPGATRLSPIPAGDPPVDRIERMLRARGPAHWTLQVEPDSRLGRWIARLAGTEAIGQHRGQIPLGVLSEAVKRALAPRGVDHLLLGLSRRDPPRCCWHAGHFLRRIDDSYQFEWRGYGLDADGEPVAVTSRIEVKARIVAELSL